MRLLQINHDDRDDKHQADDREDRSPLTALSDGQKLGRHARGNGSKDQQRHTVTDTAFGDQFAEPHDDTGTGGHDDHHQKEGPH